MGQLPVNAVVFDLGGVVLNWSPRHLYRHVFADPEEVDYFLREICTLEWHAQHDNGPGHGRNDSDTRRANTRTTPGPIAAWRERYLDMIDGYIDGMPSCSTSSRRRACRVMR